MAEKRVDYDQLASSYNQRFAANRVSGVARALTDFVVRHKLASILEAGCGTGHWLERVAPLASHCYGLDLSMGMLQHARKRPPAFGLLQGDAGYLPFPPSEFDFVFCVNAVHHFTDPSQFVHEAHRILRPDGWLVVIGSDPHGKPDRWYGYQYFLGTYQTDLARFPGERRLSGWYASAGFIDFNRQKVDRIDKKQIGRQVLSDRFLGKQACSQLVLLSEAEYQNGLARIKRDIRRAERRGEQIEFRTEIDVILWSGRKV